MIRTAGYTWADYKTNLHILKELEITPVLDKLLAYKRNWIQHVNRMPRDRLPRIMKHYSLTGRRNRGRPLKTLLYTWDRIRSTSGLTPWQSCDDDDDDVNPLKITVTTYRGTQNKTTSLRERLKFLTVFWYFFVLIIEIANCPPSGAQYLELSPRFMGNLFTSERVYEYSECIWHFLLRIVCNI